MMLTLLLSMVVSTILAAPQMSLDTTYQDIINSFDRMRPSLQSIPSALGEFGNEFGTRMETFGSTLGNQMHKVGREVDAFGNRVEQNIHKQMDNLPNMLDMVGKNFNDFGSNFGSNLNDFGSNIGGHFGSFGSSLMDQFDQHLGGLGTFESSMLGGMFGQPRSAPWWKGANVCVERRVAEGEPEDVNVKVTGNVNFHMQVAQCKEGEGFYECQKSEGDGGVLKTLTLRYTCCHGFSLINKQECTEVDLSPLEETIEELGGAEFLDLVVSTGLGDRLSNATVFVPDEEAMEDFQVELEQLKELEPADNVIYRVDDGLLAYRRRKRNALNVMVVEDQELPDIPDIVAGHIVEGFISTRDINGNTILTSVNSGQVRITQYPSLPGKPVMANCAKLTLKDQMATNGLVHMVDRVLRPTKQSVESILTEDQQFRTFVTALEEHDILETLDTMNDITVFAPTDAAFDKLDSIERGKVLGVGGCARDVIMSHILPSVICSGVVEGKISASNLLGRKVLLERDDDGNVMVDNIKLVLKDKMATNGVIHVIEEVIIQDSVRDVIEHLEAKNAKKLVELLKTSGLDKTLQSMSNITFFAPSERALSEVPPALLKELVDDPKKLEEILLHHVTPEKKTSCDLSHNLHLDTMGGGRVRVNMHRHFGHSRPLATVQCARVIQNNEQVCGGHVHVIDRVLTPPSGDLLETLAKDHKMFTSLVDFAGVADELTSSDQHTLLAPQDSAFDKLEDDIKDKMFNDKEVAAAVVRNHMIPDAICCASVPRVMGFFQQSLDRRSLLGHAIGIRRSNGGHIYANRAAFTRCDVAATNGVLHSLESVILPPVLQKKPQRGRRGFWIF